ncbi:Response regulator receiver domain-containing protein [Maribacter orientalis]|uniref:Response regulator receiver domain-containing protein n=1 Tax=Maribacter orientalis TaxID=228957 RepID=A0A1H7W3Q9_9FLAO|nr:response regulator [Maribacter orientalis]SEM15628.1 Response regulator receiver domain-containing protein [Maribacter orientalis]
MYSKIYLIDDVQLVNLMHQVLLRKLELEDKIISFTNPEKALDHLRFQETNSEPILILLDINMPEMTGFEFLEFMVLEEFPTNIDVVMVTSSIYDEDKRLAKTFPQFVKDFVSKPLKTEKLKEIVQNPMKIAL